ncbi:MAG TPA: hypothetical protein VFS10_12250 [Pyrinomonadaceae bacterium]|nr:hypothetical protein [Pyrinomonadaceae bacterium]
MGSLGRLLCAAIAILTLGIVFSDSYSVSAQLIISEFRVRGPNGANDEFIELYNNSGADHTVAGGGTGYAVAASNGVARCVVPNGTVIPNRGHYLCVNSVGYSLASYPAGNGTTATGDATYTTDIPDNAGIAIFNTSVAGDFTLANRLDAVGSTSEANTVYKEGTGYPALTPFSIDYSFYRDLCGKGGSITTFGQCPINSVHKDTNNNAADFVFVDTNGTSAGAGQRLGAPGPENLSSPISQEVALSGTLLDTSVSKDSAPNRQREGGAFCAPPNPVVLPCDPANDSTFGTLSFRRRITNNTGAPVTRLRFRVLDITTFPAPSGIADMRPRTSTATVIALINDPATCAANGVPATAPCSVTVEGTTLEQPPGQPSGGGFNSTMSAGTVTLATPLENGESISVQLLYGLQQMGSFKIYVNFEALTDTAVEEATIGPSDSSTNRKKKYAPVSAEGAAGSASPTVSGPFGAAPPAADRRIIPHVWVVDPRTRIAVPALKEESDEAEEGKKSEKKAEPAPSASEAPAPATHGPAAAEEPSATKAAPAAPTVAPVINKTPAAPSPSAATSPAARKEASVTPKAKQLKKSRRAVVRKRAALKRR